MICKNCIYWELDNDEGTDYHRCACDPSPRLDDVTEAEDGCEYGTDWPPLERTIGWTEARLRGALLPGACRMYRAILAYLRELEELKDETPD